jgi:RNA polymerase sigma-70 factor (ECF subfamily)
MSVSQSSDHDLIEAIRRGDRSAFEALYTRHKQWVVSLALRFCGDRETALDVLQETFTYFYRKLPEFELRARFRTFLYPVVKHIAIRRRGRREAPLAEPPPKEEPKEHAEDILACLPEEQAEIVWLRFVEELSLQDIAERLEIPEGTVKSRLHAALKTLRERKIL